MSDSTSKSNMQASVQDAKAAKKAAARKKFEDVFDKLRDELIERFKNENMPQEAIEWYKRNLAYNVPGGKLNRGLSTVDSVEILKGRPLTDEEYFKSALLGWCVEFLQAFFLVSDDMMDVSITRRGQPCYYRCEDVGDIAINDSFMLEMAIYQLVKSHFRKDSCYIDLVELFQETSYQTEMGQLVDLITASTKHADLAKFTIEKHTFIVRYKTSYYSFYLPVALAMRFCGVPDSYTHEGKTILPYTLALDILLPLGEYFQVQDDFLDYSGTPEQIGKIGTDIVDNKCSWCVNIALSVATPEQRKILEENYGQRDTAKEAKVKQLYEDIGLPETYRKYEENAYQRVTSLIDSIPEGAVGSAPEGTVLKKQVFKAFLDKIYKRTK